jgi:hypothetical protein
LIPQKKNFLNIQVLLLLEIAAYKKKIFCYFILLLFKIYQYHKKKQKRKERSKKKNSVQKDVYWILPQKIKKEKLDQLNSELVQILYSDYWTANSTTYQIWDQLDIVCFGFQIRV